MKRIIIFLLILTALLSVGCSADESQDIKQTEQTQQATQKSERIDVESAEFEQQMHGNYVLLDVRSYDEFDEGHIDGATLIPVDELEERWAEIEEYDKVLVYCRSGNRSVAASDILIDNGFQEVYNLLGGISAWNNYKK